MTAKLTVGGVLSSGGEHEGIRHLIPAIRKRQCTCNVTMDRIHIIIVALGKQQHVYCIVEPHVAVNTVAFIESVGIESQSELGFNCCVTCCCQRCFYGDFMSAVTIKLTEVLRQSA